MRMRLRSALIVVACLPIFSLAGSASWAQTYPRSWTPERPPRVVEDRFRIEVGVMSVAMDTQLRVDPSATVRGTEINAEEDLGLDDAQILPQIELTLLPGERHLVRLSAFNARRDAQKIITKEIVFDDQVYRANERVDSSLDIQMAGLAYGYRFIATQQAELAATFGIQIADVDANAVVRSRVLREAESGVAPIPLVGAEGRFAFSSRWSLEGRAQYLGGAHDDIDASMLDARVAALWRQNPHLVWGLGYRAFRIEVDSADEGSPGRIDLKFDGPQLFLRASL